MEQLTLLATRKNKTVTRLSKNSKLIKTIIHAIQEKKGSNIITLDLRKINEAVADFFIICEATNTTQVKAIADFVEEEVQNKCDEKAYHHEGYQAAQWILVDYINAVVHVMMPETRKFYSLEEMWSDGAAEEINEEVKKPAKNKK